jgi:hypothetical protein
MLLVSKEVLPEQESVVMNYPTNMGNLFIRIPEDLHHRWNVLRAELDMTALDLVAHLIEVGEQQQQKKDDSRKTGKAARAASP